MIGQQINPERLVPLALDLLAIDPLTEGDLYPGALLRSVLRLDIQFWRDHKELAQTAQDIVRGFQPLAELDPDLEEDKRELIRMFSRLEL